MNKFDSTKIYTQEELLRHSTIILNDIDKKFDKLIKELKNGKDKTDIDNKLKNKKT